MTSHTPRQQVPSRPMLRTIGRIVGVFAIIGAVIPILLVVIQRVSAVQARTRFPAPGQLVDVDGHDMHIHCEGESETGRPTVVIDTDNANFSLDWVGVQRDLADTLRVCIYDRAGYGWSEPVAVARTADEAAVELHDLLEASGETGPYLLVGHGLGGVDAQLYAARYADDLAGMVLIDPWTEVSLSPSYSTMWRRRVDVFERMRFLTSSGLIRILHPLVRRLATPPWVAMLPQDVQGAYMALVLDRAYYDATTAEVQALPVSLGQVQEALHGDVPLGELPLIVLTSSHIADPGAGPYSAATVPTPDAIVAADRKIAGLSLHGERRSLRRTQPWLQVDVPGSVEAAVHDAVAMARVWSGTP